MNAMKHGLLAADLVVRDEDPVEFARVLENLVNELQAQGPLEEQLVERVAACMWRLRRLYCQSALNFDPLSASNIDPSFGTVEVVPVVHRGDPRGFV